MEPIMEQLKIRRITGNAVAQTVVEGEVPLPLEYPQVQRVLHSCGDISILSVQVLDDRVMVDGSLSVRVVCISKEGTTFAFSSRSNFRHTMPVEGVNSNMNANATAEVQSLNVKPGNDGFLKLDASIDLYAKVTSEDPIDVLTGVRGVTDVEKLVSPIEITTRNSLGTNSMRIREEVTASEVENVVLPTAQAIVKDVNVEGNEAAVEGILAVNALYEDASGRLNTWTQQIPFGQLIPCNAQGNVEAQANVSQLMVRPLGEGFDAVSVEAIVDVELFALENENVMALQDAYSPSVPFECETKKVQVLNDFNSVKKNTVMRESIALPEGNPEIARVSYSDANPLVTNHSVYNGVASIEGILLTNVIYETPEGNVRSFSEDVPFMMEVEVPPNATDADVKVSANQTASGSGTTVDVAYTLTADINPYAVNDVTVATNVHETEPGEQPKGIVIYFAGENETLWEVAKNFKVPQDLLKAQNPNVRDVLKEGEKLILFPKRVG